MPVVNPISNPEAYDCFALGGVRWPPIEFEGKIDLDGASSPRTWDKVASQGTTGATLKYNGAGLAEFKVKAYLWEPRHFDAFERDLRPMLRRPKEGVKGTAYSWQHPETDKLEIRRVVVSDCSQLRPDGDAGLYYYEISLTEYRPPKPVRVLKVAAGESTDKPAKPKTERERQLDGLRTDFNNLPRDYKTFF